MGIGIMFTKIAILGAPPCNAKLVSPCLSSNPPPRYRVVVRRRFRQADFESAALLAALRSCNSLVLRTATGCFTTKNDGINLPFPVMAYDMVGFPH